MPLMTYDSVVQGHTCEEELEIGLTLPLRTVKCLPETVIC